MYNRYKTHLLGQLIALSDIIKSVS
uniref:Uncharacterized protein n=1 Tax=Arundo donax TaxID=35708 RepID=A0A0A8Y811_ARUDO